MAEELDEFGIPIRKKASAELDEFGIPIKKKTIGTTAKSPSPISSTPLGGGFQTPAQQPFDVTKNAPAQERQIVQQPITLGGGSKSDIGYRGTGLGAAFEENINGGYASPSQIAQSEKLQKIQQAYQGDQKSINKVQARPLDANGQIVQGFADEDLEGNRAGYLYNKVLEGVGQIASGAGRNIYGALGAFSTGPNVNLDAGLQASGEFEREYATSVREYLKENVGATVDKRLENKYNGETFTSAIGGLASSAPAIAAAIASGGVGTAAMGLQMFDNAIESINSTEEGASLDEGTKTFFAGGVAIAQTLLEKYSLDKILKSESGLISNLLTKQALKNAVKATDGKVTGDVFTKFLDKEVLNLSNKFAIGGARALDAAMLEYGTEFAQEGAAITGELLTNAATGKPVFDTEKVDNWNGFLSNLQRANKSGIAGAIGGGVLGSVSALAKLNKNKIDQNDQVIAEIDKNLADENLSDATREILVQNKIKLQNEQQEYADKIDQTYDKLDAKSKDKVNEIVEQKLKIQEAILDPAVTPEIKTNLEEQSKELDKELESVANPKEQSKEELESIISTLEARTNGLTMDEMFDLREAKQNLAKIKPVEEVKVTEDVITPKEEVKKPVNKKTAATETNTRVVGDRILENDVNEEVIQSDNDDTHNVISAETKSALDSGRKKQIIEVDEEGNQTVKEVEFTKDDADVELDRLEDLAKRGKLTPAEFQKSYFAQSTNTSSFKKGSELINKDAANFIEKLRKSFDGVQSVPKTENVEKVEAPVKEEAEQVTPVKSYGYEDIDAMVDEQQVAKELNQEIIDPSELTPVQQAIRQFGGVTTTEESYAKFGDKNNLSKEARKTSIRKNAQSLDALAEEISATGLEVTPADLVDYIDTFADGDNKLSKRAEALKEKMFDLTGKKFNKYTISKYVDKINAKARERFLAEMDAPSLSPEEIGIIEQNGINTENIDDIAQKLDWLYDAETFENIKAYLKNENKRESGSSDESGKSTERSSEKGDRVEKQPKAGDSARNFANKIREGKINKLGGFRAGTGFDAAWDLGLETIALSIEGGAKIADAIQSGLEAIKKTDWYKGLEDKANFDKQYNDHMQKEYEVEEKSESKEEKKATPSETTEFDELANRRLPTRETRETQSNVERESGDVLSADIKEFEGVDFKQSMLHGDNVVENAKTNFGDTYVTDLLEYVKQSKMPFENKAVILVSLENNLRKQLIENPKDARLKKQINVATKASIEHLRSGATAAAVGIFRQAAKSNYETQLAAESIFSTKERETRAKVEGAVFSTPEDVQVEYEQREQDIDKAIAEGVEKKIEEIYSAMPTARRQKADKAIAALDKIQKRLRSKTYDASIGVPVAIIDAGITTIKAAIRTGVSIADAVEAGIRKIKQEYGNKWDKEDDFRKDMLDGFSSEGLSIASDISNSLKDELIDAGYGKEITVTTKDGKEKRMVYDWKKLLGVEGSFENLKDAIDKSMNGKGYTQSEIDAFQQQLQDEYNDIHADIIEKSVNELNRRNAPKDGDTKPLARRLAELYNLGLYEQDVDTYSNILNNILGISPESQQAFNEIRDFNRSLAKLLETRDAKGNLLSDVALASAETQVKNHIKRVIEKVQFAEGSMYFKASVVLKNLFSAMQRMMLAKISQLVENPFSGKINDIHVQLQDAFKKGKWDTKELAKYRSMLATAMFDDIVRKGGDEYGGVGNPFTSKNTIESFVNGLSKNSLYQAFVSAMSGRVYLDAADSYFKVKRTEKEFTHNLIRILTSPTNPNGAMSQEDALKYVSEAITGQKFEDAKELARTIISDVNKDAGKEILRPSETNVIRLANDIVKDNLVNGQAMTIKQVEIAFKAGYKTSGKSIGHESNNLITDVVNKTNEVIQTKLNEALKRKDWSAAATLNLTLILSKNIISPFVGGGTNWTVIGLQKMGLPTEWLRSDVGFSKKPLDLSTKEGLKEAEKSLYANATRQRMNGRIVASTFTALSAILAMRALGDEDDYKKWLKKHPETKKIITKIQPVPLTLYLAREDGSDFVRATLDALGSRQNFDQMKFERASKEFYKGVSNDDDKAMKKAWGAIGELVGRKFMVPYLSSISNYGDVEKKVYAEFKGTPLKTDYKASKGFVQGFYKNGLMAYLGLMPEISADKPLTSSERERMRNESRREREKSREDSRNNR